MNTLERFERLNAPAPIPTQISRPFWEAAAARRLVMQKCEDCRAWVFYPRGHCPHCWGGRLAWSQASGAARLESFCVVHRPGHAAWKAVAPYALAIVRLDEGPSMLSALACRDHEALRVGMPLEVCFVQVGQFTLPMFLPAQERQGNPGRPV